MSARPKTLRDAAMDLAFDQCRIDRPADIMGCNHADDLDDAERHIDRDFRDLGCKAVTGIGVALAVRIKRRGRRIETSLCRRERRRAHRARKTLKFEYMLARLVAQDHTAIGES